MVKYHEGEVLYSSEDDTPRHYASEDEQDAVLWQPGLRATSPMLIRLQTKGKREKIEKYL